MIFCKTWSNLDTNLGDKPHNLWKLLITPCKTVSTIKCAQKKQQNLGVSDLLLFDRKRTLNCELNLRTGEIVPSTNHNYPSLPHPSLHISDHLHLPPLSPPLPPLLKGKQVTSLDEPIFYPCSDLMKTPYLQRKIDLQCMLQLLFPFPHSKLDIVSSLTSLLSYIQELLLLTWVVQQYLTQGVTRRH